MIENGPSIFAAWCHSGENPLVKTERVAMASGILKRFNDRKGCSFIEQESGPEVFACHSGINSTGLKSLDKDDSVSFEVEQDNKGASAVNVSVI